MRRDSGEFYISIISGDSVSSKKDTNLFLIICYNSNDFVVIINEYVLFRLNRTFREVGNRV